MSEHSNPSHFENDEISLKELILKIKEFVHELFSHWGLIALICIPVVLYMMYDAFTKKPEYPTYLTFTVNKDDGASMGVMSGLLGQFGFGGVQSEFNLDKILDLLKSRKITERVIFHEETIYGNKDYLANHLINYLDTLNQWGYIKWYKRPFTPKSKLEGFRFTHDSIQNFNRIENLALKAIYTKMIGTPESDSRFLKASYEEMSGVLTMVLTLKDEQLTVPLLNKYFEELSKYYIDNSIEKQKVTYDLVKVKHDSIYTALRSTEYQLADFKDSNLGIFTKKSKLNEFRLENRIRILAAGLAKATENLEVADFTLKNKTPFIQVIDRPIFPIKSLKVSKFKTLIISGFLGVLIGMAFVILRKIYRDTMAG
jgi:hypothetical protein